MAHIDIETQHPFQTLLLVGAVAWAITSVAPAQSEAEPWGSGSADTAYAVQDAEGDMRHLRERQDILENQEEILREQLAILEEELESGDEDPQLQEAVSIATERLRLLLTDKRGTEEQLLATLEQIWDAQGEGITASRRLPRKGTSGFERWPVEPKKGISAHFHDASYRKHFGVAHEGIDIPTPQGTLLRAAADGTVVKTADNGYGFSSIVLQSEGGITYLYGHVSAILVEEGQRIRAGDVVAKSGGRPGTKGAGLMTTGPHLHLEVMIDGEHKDPLDFLPEMPSS